MNITWTTIHAKDGYATERKIMVDEEKKPMVSLLTRIFDPSVSNAQAAAMKLYINDVSADRGYA